MTVAELTAALQDTPPDHPVRERPKENPVPAGDENEIVAVVAEEWGISWLEYKAPV